MNCDTVIFNLIETTKIHRLAVYCHLSSVPRKFLKRNIYDPDRAKTLTPEFAPDTCEAIC